ncbi:phospholipase D-like domain-containing protein [Devosia rhizoryzae]|nr:phospholipase D-like domain-containing protein [Devosia rhizoryzae]
MADLRFTPGQNCMAATTADRFSVIVDAEDYFRHARDVMVRAQRRITLVGWDFDARITLGNNAADGGPADLGNFILWLVKRNPELEIFLLQWDFGIITTAKRGTTLIKLWQWLRHKRIHVKFDSAHPTGASHHQKIILIDDAMAFVGGIDMTGARWDTREHRHEDPRRRRPTTRRPYKPWHDVTTAVTGPIVSAVVDLVQDRWGRAGVAAFQPISDGVALWPEGLEIDFADVDIAISRTAPKIEDYQPILEVEKLWLDQIATAKNLIYIESQYFASRAIVSAMAKRLQEQDGPEIVVINPDTADGWLQPLAMDTARARLFTWIKRADKFDRLRLYHPVGLGGEAIYVHAKALVADDTVLKVGSSNINNRSLRLDTECDITIVADADDEAVRREIAWTRNDLLGEHLGVTAEAVAARLAETGSLIKTIETLRGTGRTLRDYQVPELNDIEKWLADNEVLDPEGPEEMFEPLSQRGLMRGFLKRFARKPKAKGRA